MKMDTKENQKSGDSEAHPSNAPLYVLFSVLVGLLALTLASSQAFSAEVRHVWLTDDSTTQAPISSRGTALSFPVRPTQVILGQKGSFGIEYVERDLVVTPLAPNARAHLFVYLYGRRFTFDLVAVMNSEATIIIVRDGMEPKPAKVPRKNAVAASHPPTPRGSGRK
ncbi:MAG: hypothetical protein JST16_02795 [Bdellovibrionales bacterium]|nr:hypothetical protein [Bdellovibrionales bacterium]